MLIQPYTFDELMYSYCYRIYLRFRTHRGHSRAPLAKLNASLVNSLVKKYQIHILEGSGSLTDLMLLISLQPSEKVSACAGKVKGQVSKWLRQQLQLEQPTNLLSKGYFAVTAGQTRAEAVERYLSQQGKHHGYLERTNPPIFVKTFELTDEDEARLRAQHAWTSLRFHLVLATHLRKGVFTPEAAMAVANSWEQLQHQWNMALLKVSFVPDHVHLAVRVHPATSPGHLLPHFMNSAQELIWSRFSYLAIEAGVPRLWQPSAYLGSYGDLASAQISKYIEGWDNAV